MSSKPACQRKVRYTKRQAKAQVRLRQSGGRHYFCEHCNGWHVASDWPTVSEHVWKLVESLHRRTVV